APGETSQTIRVKVFGDNTFEPNETFGVFLESATDAVLTTGAGVGIIQDNDPLTITIPTGNAQNDLTLRLDRDDLVLTGNGTELFREGAAISILLTIVGDPAAANRLTIDMANGNPIPMGGLRFVGGAGSNRLAVIGAAAVEVVNSPSGTGA